MIAMDYIRNRISRSFTCQKDICLLNNVPSGDMLEEAFSSVDALGLYLHIPFCEKICPYCPYNKEVYRDAACAEYVQAVIMEINTYVPLLKNKPFTSFYIGGSTPTIMLGKGIDRMIHHIYKRFNMNCQVHMEGHPNHLTEENLDMLTALGVKYLSIGIEAFQDHHLRVLERPYTVAEVRSRIEKAVSRNFSCVNVDYIFDLPFQTEKETAQAGKEMVKMGVHQAATYPLFRFPYTRFGKENNCSSNALATMLRRRRMQKILEEIHYAARYHRASVWAYTN